MKLKIWRLRCKARKQYLKYHSLLASWSCGATLAKHICINVVNARLALQDTLAELERLGENLHE